MYLWGNEDSVFVGIESGVWGYVVCVTIAVQISMMNESTKVTSVEQFSVCNEGYCEKSLRRVQFMEWHRLIIFCMGLRLRVWHESWVFRLWRLKRHIINVSMGKRRFRFCGD